MALDTTQAKELPPSQEERQTAYNLLNSRGLFQSVLYVEQPQICTMNNTTSHSQRELVLRRQIVALLPRLRRFARNLTGDSDRGDDLVQVACERALQRLAQFRDDSRLDSWLYKIIHTQWIDQLRRRRTRESHVREQNLESRAGNVLNLPVKDMEAALDIRNAMAQLPNEHRAAISLVVVEGYTYGEAAEVLDIPTGTVASRVARGRQELIKQLRYGNSESVFKAKVNAGGTN